VLCYLVIEIDNNKMTEVFIIIIYINKHEIVFFYISSLQQKNESGKKTLQKMCYMYCLLQNC
jgi:hypothetical protein